MLHSQLAGVSTRAQALDSRARDRLSGGRHVDRVGRQVHKNRDR